MKNQMNLVALSLLIASGVVLAEPVLTNQPTVIISNGKDLTSRDLRMLASVKTPGVATASKVGVSPVKPVVKTVAKPLVKKVVKPVAHYPVIPDTVSNSRIEYFARLRDSIQAQTVVMQPQPVIEKPVPVAVVPEARKYYIKGNTLVSTAELAEMLKPFYEIPNNLVTIPGKNGGSQVVQVQNQNNLSEFMANDPNVLVAAITHSYRIKGYQDVRVEVVMNEQGQSVLLINEGLSRVKGRYAKYLEQNVTLTNDEFDVGVRQAQRQACAEGNKVLASRAVMKDGTADILLTATDIMPDDTQSIENCLSNTSGFLINNFTDAPGTSKATGLLWASGKASGLEWNASASKELIWGESNPDNTYSWAGSLYKPTWMGTFGVDLSVSRSRKDGAYTGLNIMANTSNLTLSGEHYLNKNFTFNEKVNYTRQKKTLGLFSFEDEMNYGSLWLGSTFQNNTALNNGYANAFAMSFGVEQGLGGVRSYKGNKLFGVATGSFTAFKADLAWSNLFVNTSLIKDDFGRPKQNSAGELSTVQNVFKLDVKSGIQFGSDSTPERSQLAIGGKGRGSSYTTGTYAAPSGAYLGIQLSTPEMTVEATQSKNLVITPYAGLNGAIGKAVVGSDVKAASFEVGATMSINKVLDSNLSWSQHLDHDTHQTSGKLNYELNIRF